MCVYECICLFGGICVCECVCLCVYVYVCVCVLMFVNEWKCMSVCFHKLKYSPCYTKNDSQSNSLWCWMIKDKDYLLNTQYLSLREKTITRIFEQNAWTKKSTLQNMSNKSPVIISFTLKVAFSNITWICGLSGWYAYCIDCIMIYQRHFIGTILHIVYK